MKVRAPLVMLGPHFGKKMWHLKIPPKIRIFSWRACMNALPTLQNLRRRGVNTDKLCPLCNESIKCTTHALLLCEKEKEVWSNWLACQVNLLAVNQDVSVIAMKLLANGTTEDLEINLFCHCVVNLVQLKPNGA